MALGHHLPVQGHVFHADRGSQYASDAHLHILKASGILCSMSRKGNYWNNACAERCFATLKTELIHRQPRPTRTAARFAIHEHIAVLYNGTRRHSFLGHQSPVDFEDAFHENEGMAA
jgi:transposase InsO family protein